MAVVLLPGDCASFTDSPILRLSCMERRQPWPRTTAPNPPFFFKSYCLFAKLPLAWPCVRLRPMRLAGIPTGLHQELRKSKYVSPWGVKCQKVTLGRRIRFPLAYSMPMPQSQIYCSTDGNEKVQKGEPASSKESTSDGICTQRCLPFSNTERVGAGNSASVKHPAATPTRS